MSFSITFFLNGGLFDFDLTFLAEGVLFLFFSIVVTIIFLTPVAKQLKTREEFIDSLLLKSNLLLAYGYKKLSLSVRLLTEEMTELNRQIKLLKLYTNTHFDTEIEVVKQENARLISELKGELAINSSFLFSKVIKKVGSLTDFFFAKKFR